MIKIDHIKAVGKTLHFRFKWTLDCKMKFKQVAVTVLWKKLCLSLFFNCLIMFLKIWLSMLMNLNCTNPVVGNTSLEVPERLLNVTIK